ncbi:MBL fold metallo-hydrolase [Streptomyces sp. LHD-70]|uniref:MBL fold metallo-hydrolase n=1 Tax=Streptomyces sp. LHD-70 TaxID=3072140 RepID=UPI00280CB39C|nr:MBL fold metallo-hydrolase [Streptomyces sp. LHD-70]MDQ8701122.1 MBL fold metallo-hydrolase [Streptomyces sp. LHD-70]
MAALALDVYTSPLRDLPGGGSFSPTTATLVMGPTEAVLIDTGYAREDVDEIAARVTRHGKALSAICITHAHPDHYLGLGALLKRFPDAKPVAAPPVADAIRRGLEAARTTWRARFEGLALDNTIVPEPLDGSRLTVDGEVLHVMTIGQGDIPDNTVVHVPCIDAVVAGDVVYNGVHPFLGASGPDEWPQWIASIDAIAALSPRRVVAGHKRPELPDDDLVASLGATRSYIAEFIQAVDQADSARDVISRMLDLYPDHANPSALISAAKAAINRRTSTHA